MLFLEEYTGNALTLYLYMMYKALPNGLLGHRSVACYGTRLTVVKERYSAKLLERQCQRTILAPTDIRTNDALTGIISIEGKGHTTDIQFGTFEMLQPQEEVACQFKPE